MKLLLTSEGLKNQSIANALFELVGKKPEEISLAFIPTAANVILGDKGWFIDDLVNLKKQNFKSIDIVDISALDKKQWLPRLESVDVLYFGGGYTYHLMEWLNKTGLVDLLPELLKTRVYMGASTGSIVTGKKLVLNFSEIIYEEMLDRADEMTCLNFVDFYFIPHLNARGFPEIKKENISEIADKMSETIYAMDDNSALKVVDGKVDIVSGGVFGV